MHDSQLHTLFFAQSMGLYLVIVGIIMLARAPYYKEMLTHLKAGSASIVVGASFGLILGISLVLVHNIWVLESEVLVTLVAWFLLIKSVLWLGFPEAMVSYSKKFYSDAGYYFVAGLALIIGIILMAHGFYLFM